jgi:hypothetical protein
MTRFWNIEYEDDLLDRDGAARRAVRTYQAMRGISQPEAVAEMLLGYAKVVSIPEAPLNGSPPMERRMGRTKDRQRHCVRVRVCNMLLYIPRSQKNSASTSSEHRKNSATSRDTICRITFRMGGNR